jgi:hypothetical protein
MLFLFSLTLFVSSMLLFLVEPFFQAALSS